MEYSGASRLFEKSLSPTQSLTRENARSFGARGPPCQPHAVASDAEPASSPSRNKSRRERSVMAREPPTVPAGDHRPQRRGVHEEDQEHVDDGEGDEQPDRPEMPVAGELVASEESGEPRELDRLVDRVPGEHGEDAQQEDEAVGRLLEGVVLPLRRMLPAQAEVVELHPPGRRNVARAEQERPPFSRSEEIDQIDQPGQDQGPRQGEMPVEAAGQPAAE